MAFKIQIDQEASEDIQKAIEWYNQHRTGLGRRFHEIVKTSINGLSRHPFYAIRYRNVRCLPLKKFPYMIHYTVDETHKIVVIQAVFHTSRDPERWDER